MKREKELQMREEREVLTVELGTDEQEENMHIEVEAQSPTSSTTIGM